MMTVTRRRRRRRDHVAARHGTGPKRGRLQVGGSISCWAWWRDTFWHRRWSLSLQPALSKTSESHVRSSSCHSRATSDPVGPSVAGRPRRGGPPAVVSELHSSGESGDAGRRQPRGSSGLRGQPEPASPSGHGRRARDGEVCRAAAVTD